MNREDLYYAIEEEASYQKLINVLRAVVELHKPYTYTNYLKQELQFCSVCEVGNPPDSYPYPCPTIQAIEKELG